MDSHICDACNGHGEVEDTLENIFNSFRGLHKSLPKPSEPLVWHSCDDQPVGWTETEAVYLYVKITGDSESIDGHLIYSFPDYYTLMQVNSIEEWDDEPGSVISVGLGEEIWYDVIEWAYISPTYYEELKLALETI